MNIGPLQGILIYLTSESLWEKNGFDPNQNSVRFRVKTKLFFTKTKEVVVRKETLAKIADYVFWTQMVAAVLFGVRQVSKMTVSVEGLTITSFACNLTFCILNLVLALRAHKVQPSKETSRAKWIYITGIFNYSALVMMMVMVAPRLWDYRDTITMGVVLIGAALVLIRFNFQVAQPMVRGWLALALKGLPQIILAWKVWTDGGDGLDPVMVVVFHYLTLSRLFQIWIIVREAGWDKNRIALATSEIGNELTWCLVTIAWLVHL
jgi:hypothetical protein